MNPPAPHSHPVSDGLLRVPLPQGTRLDHYVVHSVLGSGGFGITYLASHHLLGRLYAIKEYFPDEFSYREGQSVRSTPQSEPTYRWGLERFLSEARALARFKHPSIVDVISVFEANHTAYMVLAYEQGKDMGVWARELGRPPTQSEMDQVLVPLLDALDAVHARGLLHRDIAPDNVLIRSDGTPVLIDFGSARESIRGRSKVMSAIVKRGYSPPEQYTSRPELQGAWSDIYALSATVYKLISGTMPADATDRMLDDILAPVGKLTRSPFRRHFLAAIDRGLRIHSRDRPQTIAAWREDLFRSDTGEAPVWASTSASVPVSRQPPMVTGHSAPPTGADAINGTAATLAGTDGSGRARVSGAEKSERPDMSWLDEPLEPEEAPKPQSAMEHPGIRKLAFGLGGLVGGAVCGALASIVLASILASNCSSDSCVGAFLPGSTAAGALVGLLLGLWFQPGAEETMVFTEHDDR